MSTQHVAWPSIELLHNTVRTVAHLHDLGAAFPTVEYRAKIKLHGSNCAVQVAPDGRFAQSRTSLITPESDFKGFAAWALASDGYFASLLPGTTVFGEWCGPGVEKGMAISQRARKAFAVFAVLRGDRIVYEPDEIRALVPADGAPDDLYVLPWEGEPIAIEFGARASLEAAAADLNVRVEQIEREDPWVKRALGISGLGEGLVLYPVRIDGRPVADSEELARLMFKAKGEKHRTAGTRTAAQVDASVVASIDELVALMVTEARLAQGVAAVGGRDRKLTGAFVAWISDDVRKESVAELEASGLTWAQVEKPVQQRARAWFLAA
jgi:hypothetical protein